MKKLNTLVFLVLLSLFFGSLQGQNDRYLKEVFSEIEIQTGITYAENFTVLYVPQVGEPVREQLKMDIYQPANDTVTDRPLVILMHTGNFLPIVLNAGLTGTRTDSSTVEIAKRLARMGYVVASIDYRLGWNPLAPTQPERTLGLIQAAYRGVQDARTCIRYFRKDVAEGGNQYGIDPDKIVVWGQGTGGYITLVALTLDDFNKVVTTTNPPDKFVTDLDGNPNTLEPMVNPLVNGDIVGLAPVPPYPNQSAPGILPIDSGPLHAGDTLNLPNHPGYSSEANLFVNMGGALGDISWLEAGQAPVICFHVPSDPYAPYIDDVLIVPTTGETVVQVQGSKMVVEKSVQVGNNDPFMVVETEFPANKYPEFAAVTAQAKANSTIAGHDYFEGLYPLPRMTNEHGNEEGSPWQWWDPNATPAGYPLPWNLLPHPTDETGATSFHEEALQDNADMSPEKGRSYIDTIMNYFAPRAALVLNLQTSRVPVLSDSQVALNLSPNPAGNQVYIQTGIEYPIQEVQLFDITGRLLQSNTRINANSYTLQRGNLPTGMYVARLRFEKGIVAKKILFR